MDSIHLRRFSKPYCFSPHLLLRRTLYFASAPSFVPRSQGGLGAPLPKAVVASRVYGGSRPNTQATSGAASVKMMPIGVPKVAYRVPGSQQADWYVLLS